MRLRTIDLPGDPDEDTAHLIDDPASREEFFAPEMEALATHAAESPSCAAIDRPPNCLGGDDLSSRHRGQPVRLRRPSARRETESYAQATVAECDPFLWFEDRWPTRRVGRQ